MFAKLWNWLKGLFSSVEADVTKVETTVKTDVNAITTDSNSTK